MFRGAKTAGMIGGGGLLGGLGGQVSDALSAPRRALWNALGGPDTGAELLGNMGMDPNGVGASLLGPLVEMAGDPLSYAGAVGGLAGRLAPQAMGLMGDAKGVGSLEKFAAQAMQNPMFAEAGALRGVGGGAAAIGEAVPVTAGLSMPAGFEPSALPPLSGGLPPELQQILQSRQNTPLSEMFPFPINRPPQAASDAEMLAFRPDLMGGPTTGTFGGVQYGGGPPGVPSSPSAATNPALPPLDTNAPGTQFMPPPGMSGMPATSPTLPQAQPPLLQALGLPDPGAGLGQAYPQTPANMPQMPLGVPGYKMLSPEVEALLQQMNLPPTLTRGQLPPWAQVRGGRVFTQPGVNPQDILAGAQARGY